jgi:hypothetical protein
MHPKKRKGPGERGIIIPIGAKPFMAAGAYATIMGLRERFDCNLAVELWSYPSEIAKMTDSFKAAVVADPLIELRAIPVPLDSERHVPSWDTRGEWYKDYYRFASMPLALIHTRFEEVIALDADAVLLADPRQLFDSHQYRETGTFFLHDKLIQWWAAWYPPYDKTWVESFMNAFDMSKFDHIHVDADSEDSFKEQRRRGVLQERTFTQHTMESSLVVLDKRRHARTVAVLEELTVARGPEVYSHVYGDKETYWMAASIAGQPFAFNEWAPSHWSNPTTHGGLQTCAGNEYAEPGLIHYMPMSHHHHQGDVNTSSSEAAAAVSLLSINECKVIGCVQFGLRHMKLSGPITRDAHKTRFYGAGGNVPLNVSTSRLPKGTKSVENGRATAGVLLYHDKWYAQVPCTKIDAKLVELLLLQRDLMSKGMRLFCGGKCRKHQF